MPDLPPRELVATLERLGLATGRQVAAMSRRVARLARDLPRFDSVWIDALAQARVLTPFQAAELNAGRAESLRVGPYVLCERTSQPYYVACYRAKNVESGESVRLAIVENAGPRAEDLLGQLQSLADRLAKPQVEENMAKPQTVSNPKSPSLPRSPAPPLLASITGSRLFIAAPWIDGRSAAEWIVHHGRFPPEVVLEIARAMVAQLTELETLGVCHGDVSAASLIVTDAGDASLVLPGVRGILRPEEGYAHADLPPEAFDAMAPERIASGTPASTTADIYACGCVWWHLLCGRPPLAGGSSLMKLRAAQAAKICDVRRYAPDVPPTLSAAIAACVAAAPSGRPESMARLAAMLGSPTKNGKDALADCLARAGRPTIHWTTTVRSVRRSNRTPLWLAGAACCLAAVVAIFWPGSHVPNPTSEIQNPMVRVSRRSPLVPPVPSIPSSSPVEKDEGKVVPAAYQTEAAPADIVLSGERPMQAASLKLHAGLRVCAAQGRRATLHVPDAGLIVDQENVRFENIDFVWIGSENYDSRKDDNKNDRPAIVRLQAGRAEFRGCTFRCNAVKAGRDAPPAIRWTHPSETAGIETALPSGQIRLTDCMFDRVGAAVDCGAIGALDIEVVNSLHVGGGPLLRFDHYPRPDEPVAIALSQVTLRETGPLLECFALHGENQPGEIAVTATACVFAPRQGEPLVRCGDAGATDRMTRGFRWTGQGSLVTPDTQIFSVCGSDGRQQAIDETLLSIAGLVRSEVGFAGRASSDPAVSRVLQWQAPLRSANPPGSSL